MRIEHPLCRSAIALDIVQFQKQLKIFHSCRMFRLTFRHPFNLAFCLSALLRVAYTLAE